MLDVERLNYYRPEKKAEIFSFNASGQQVLDGLSSSTI